jgi:hypothetical protein
LYGGTGLTSYTPGDLLYASGATTLAGTSTANLKASLALNNVENTALSTWAGSSNITTLGTITSGTWNGNTIGVANGGTGATTYGQGWIYSNGGTGALSASTSPTVAFITATSTTATSTLYGGLSVSNSNFNVLQNGRLGLFTTSPRADLDLASNAFFLGSDSGANTRTNSTIKIARLVAQQYLNSGVGSTMMIANNTSGNNDLYIGGGSASYNSATAIRFYTGAGATTLTGTIQGVIDSSGNFGLGTTTPYTRLSVEGNSALGNSALAGYFISTSTSIASVLPYASSTAISAGTICLVGDSCRTTWPTGSSVSYDFDQQSNYGVLSLTPTTTIPVWFKDQVFASSSAIFAGDVTSNRFISTSTSVASVFPYASTTALSATTICLVGDSCRTSWPSGGGGAFPFITTTFGASTANSTSTLVGFTAGIYSLASSTIGDGSQIGGLTISSVAYGEVVPMPTSEPK